MNNANFYFSLHQHVTVLNQVKLLIIHHLLTFYWFIFSLFTLLLCLMLCLGCPVVCKRAALQNIQGHSFEWNTPLYINYVDFKKAFGSVYPNTRGKTLHYDRFPPNIITITKIFHKWFECSVLMDNTLTDWFSVQCWVRHGCTVSLTLDQTESQPRQQQINPEESNGPSSQLEDLDFADFSCSILNKPLMSNQKWRQAKQTCQTVAT